MSTFTQLTKKPRRSKIKHTRYFYLFQGRPQKAVKCITATLTMAPRKPNSARRKFVNVGWFQSRGFYFVRRKVIVGAYVPGEIKTPDFAPQKNSDLLIQCGRVKDLPGMKYRIIRGHKKSLRGLSYRRTSRSKYGAKFLHISADERDMRFYKKFKYL